MGAASHRGGPAQRGLCGARTQFARMSAASVRRKTPLKNMSLLSPPPEPSNKYKALTYTGVALAVALAAVLYFALRYYPEKKAAEHFLDALVANDTKQAYQLWKPGESYRYGDFLADWGPDGYYGPVKSYEI